MPDWGPMVTPISDLDMTRYPDLTRQNALSADGRTSGNADLGHQKGIFSHGNIMGDVHQIIGFDAFLNPCFPVCRAIDGVVRPDLDIIVYLYNSQMGDFVIDPIIRGVPESVAADDGSRMDGHAAADSGAVQYGDIGENFHVAANDHMVSQYHMGMKGDPIPKGDMILNNRKRRDGNIFTHLNILTHMGTRTDTGP